MSNNIIIKMVHVVRICIKFCTDRHTSDGNVKYHMIILQRILKARDTH